jgi:hypothetical protein
MKSLQLIIVILFASVRMVAQCEESEAAAKQMLGENFIADPNFVQAQLAINDSLSFEALWLGNNTYRVAASSTDKAKIIIKLFDENNNLVFDNSAFNYPSAWTFFLEHSMKVRGVVQRVGGSDRSSCLTVITGFRK